MPDISGFYIPIGPSVAVQAVSCSRVTQWPLNSLVFSLSSLFSLLSSELITQCVVVVVMEYNRPDSEYNRPDPKYNRPDPEYNRPAPEYNRPAPTVKIINNGKS